jgi:dolichol kinase
MATGSDITDRIAALIPGWLGHPLSVASTITAFVAAGLILWSASTGSVAPAVWAGACFVLAALLWYLAEFARDEP